MSDLKVQRIFELRPDVAAALHDYCFATGYDPTAVVDDAVALLLDTANAEADADEDATEEAAEVTLEIFDEATSAADGVLRLVTP
jgi:hypothetical protein